MTSGKERTREEIREIVESIGYTLLDEYMNKNYRRVIIQDSDGYKYDKQLNDVMRGHPPNFVDSNNPFTLFNISLWLERNKKSFILCEGNVYKGNKENLSFKCLKITCEETFSTSWTEIYSQGCGCPFCSGHRIGDCNNLAYLRPDLAREWDYDKNSKSPDEYSEFSHKKAFWICSECNHRWEATIANRSNGTGCPKCNFRRGAKKVHKFLSEYKIKFKSEFPLDGCKYKGQLYLDFYLVDLNIGIEYNGQQHYKPVRFSYSISEEQSKERLRLQKIKDRIKYKYCKNKSIPLLIIPYWEFDNIEQILAKYLFKNSS